VIKRSPPAAGGFFFGWFPNEEPAGRPEEHVKFCGKIGVFRRGLLPPGSSLGNHLKKKHPRGWGVPAIIVGVTMVMSLGRYDP